MTQLYIHAVNIHQGGGRTLLEALLNDPGINGAIVQVDARMSVPTAQTHEIQVRRIRPSVFQRLLAEWWLARHVKQGDVVLCFGNLPPLMRSSGRVTVFLQNRYLVDDVELRGFPFRTRLRLMAERLWLSARKSNADAFVVQTPSMRRLLEARTSVPVFMLPFMASYMEYRRDGAVSGASSAHETDFLYVASGEPHKNHRRLIEAWCLLADQGLYPSLKLTLDRSRFPELCGWMEHKIAQYRLNVENLGALPHEQVIQAYGRAKALVYPSTFESFGLPLIEARQAGLSILASELDYVRDVVDPEEVFDPSSEVSIARAVKRFLGKEEAPLPLQDATGFLNHILEKAK